MEEKFAYHRHLQAIANSDLVEVVRKDHEYGSSWKKRGGTSAFHIMVRKADRIEAAVERINYDIFQALRNDTRKEGLIDDIRDLRRYLDLLEAWAIEEGILPNPISGKMVVQRPTGVDPRVDKTGQKHPFGYDPKEENETGEVRPKNSATNVRARDELGNTRNDAKSSGSKIRGDRS